MLTRIRNANRRAHETVDMPASKLKVEIARMLSDEGYIDAFARRARRRATDVLTVDAEVR